GYVWCNPPYSDISPWVQKAIEEAEKGVGTVMLLPVDMSVGWFKAARLSCTEVRVIIGGRIAFINANTQKPVKGNNKGSMFLIFRPLILGAMQTTYVDRDAMLQLGERVAEWRSVETSNCHAPVESQSQHVAEPEPTTFEPDLPVSEPESAISEPDLPAPEPELAISEPESAIFEPEIEEAIKQDDVLPTHIADITDLRVRAALAAAFGEKEVYSFSESKFAHTWIADSFEFPTIITVSSEVIARAIATSQRYQITELINNSGCTGPQVDRLNALLEFVSAVYSEWFIPIMRELIERVKANAVENIREMRNIADSVIHEFLCDPITAIKSAGLAVAQVDALCAVLSDIDAGDFGEFDRADLMPALNKLVGYVRSRNIDNARYMRIYLRKYTVINGTVAA
ncbi:MAG: DNA N-6-adenine-methyltransferase, partial [Plesiomonas sp.]